MNFNRMHFAMLLLSSTTMLVCGCKSSAGPSASSSQSQPVQTPSRPTVPPPPFKVFHEGANTVTIVTAENATNDQIASLIWQLRDAAQAGKLDDLKINQKLVDARDPIEWFHIYRGPKCASEKYASGPPPCGASYHAAGEYTLGSFVNRQRDAGAILQDESHQIDLWNPDVLYVAPAQAVSGQK